MIPPQGISYLEPSSTETMGGSQTSLSSNVEDFRYSSIYCQLAQYRGQIYAVKKIKKKTIDITRKMKMELKEVGHNPHQMMLSQSPHSSLWANIKLFFSNLPNPFYNVGINFFYDVFTKQVLIRTFHFRSYTELHNVELASRLSQELIIFLDEGYPPRQHQCVHRSLC
jgi:hypothetical protein